jgi:uncharacterized membrane protein YfcA
VLWAVVIAAAVLRSFTGFGFALAAVPGFALFLSPAQAVVLSASLSLALGVQTFPQYRGKTPLGPMIPMFLAAIVGTLVGARVLVMLSVDVFMLLIGAAVIGACLALSVFHPRPRQAGTALRLGAGLSSGLMNGAFAIPGPPIIIYAMATESDPAASRALMILFFTFASLVAMLAFGAGGLVSVNSLWLFLLGYPAMFIGDRLGYHLFMRYGGRFYRRVALIALFLVGVSILLKGFGALL